MTITLQESLRGLFYAPFYAALTRGMHAAEGADIRFVSSPTPGEAGNAIMRGDADVSWGGPMRVMETYHLDPACDLVCFCEVVTRDPFLLVGRVPRPDFRVTDLTGLRFASVSEVPTPWMCLQEDLRRAGVDPASVPRIADRTMAANMEGLLAGDVDVVQLFEPFVSTLVLRHGCHVWHAQASRGPTSYTTFYTRRGTLAARRDELIRMVRAIHKTLRWIQDAPVADIVTAVRPYFPDAPQDILEMALTRLQGLGVWGRDPILPRAGYERLRESLVSGGLVPTGTPYEVAVDNSLAEAVLAELG
jgi:NitT/TauT family transport system substrate-binding protein